MSTINVARAVIYDRFITNWNDETAFDLDNESFDRPEDQPWVRMVVRNRTTGQESLGPVGLRKFLRKGAVFTQIFVPINTGVEEADRLAEIIRVMFEGVRLTNGVWFYESEVREVGAKDGFYQIIVESIFNYEQTK